MLGTSQRLLINWRIRGHAFHGEKFMRKQPRYMGVTYRPAEIFCVITYRRSHPNAQLDFGSQFPADWLGRPFITGTSPFQTPHGGPALTTKRVLSKRIILI